jgi:hypothetical protein
VADGSKLSVGRAPVGAAHFNRVTDSLNRLQLDSLKARALSHEAVPRSKWASSVAPLVSDLDRCLVGYLPASTGLGGAHAVLSETRTLTNVVDRHCQLVISCGLDSARSTEEDQRFEFVLCAASLDSLMAQLAVCSKVVASIDSWVSALATDDLVREDFGRRVAFASPDAQTKYKSGRTKGVLLSLAGGGLAIGLSAVLFLGLLRQGSVTTSDADWAAAVVLLFAAVALAAGVGLYARGLRALDAYHEAMLARAERKAVEEVARPGTLRP